MNKKDNYIVKCNNSEETQKVVQFVKPHLRSGMFSHWNYVVSNTDEATSSIYDSKPLRFSGYPVITFKEWETLPNEEFILPEKWAIKITSDNLEEVGNYYNRQGSTAYTDTDNIGRYYVSHNLSNGASIMGEEKYGANFVLVKIPFGYTKITTEQFRKFVLGITTTVNEEFILPENWHIIVTEENKVDVRNWRDYQNLEVGKITGMLKYSSGRISKGHNPNTPTGIKNEAFDFGTEITYEQFKKHVLKIESFPEKFAVLNEGAGCEDLIEYANKYGAIPPYNIDDGFYYHFPDFDGCTTSGHVQEGYTLVTIEDFRKNILNKETMEEIIQYRVKPEFSKLSKVLFETFNIDAFGGYARFDTKSVLKEQYEKAGVLNIWFEPQTKKSFTLPDINGYKGEDKGDYLLYGCAKLPVAWFTAIYSSPWNRDIKSLELSSGVKINEGEMNTIRTYLKHR